MTDARTEQPNSEQPQETHAIKNEFVLLAQIFLEKLNIPLKDAQKNAHALFAETLSKMDLVTRDELERQQLHLKQAQDELADIKQKIAQLQSQMDDQ